ncbi:MAG: hypothetical protein CBB82_01185 [Betaproteobacteria bacterium TMED22]|nr:MAG: hypothetical protein CBB82_01185 [Betaproteobacteria bacterium TMED22]|tara:strand:+ start:845 stop:1327 length:483 start_codon:yes stop_codon:yes gene_type:complete
MKIQFIITLISLLLVPTYSWSESMENLVLRDGLFYQRSSSTPYTGELDDKRSQGSIVNGRQVGAWIAYWKNGQISSRGNYKNGEQNGSWLYYYDNGSLWSEESWKKGIQDGPWITYWDNGQLKSKGNYKNGKREGPWVSYWKNGEISEWESGTFKNGERE